MNRASTSRDETLAAKAAMGAEDVAKAKMLAETHHHDPAVLAEVPAEFVAKPKVGGVNE